VRASWRRLRRNIPVFLKGALRRQADTLLPNRGVREYRAWMSRRLAERARLYPTSVAPGLLSIVTAVWDGSPIRYLKALAESIAKQNPDGACEWVLLDNGCSNRVLRGYLKELGRHEWIKIHRLEKNTGIASGLRYCLEHATNRYIAPVDADDWLYPDALRILSAWIQSSGFPAALYTDEDKIIGKRFYQPYLKPDWDPVLLANSAYVAHLGVVERERALRLGAYSDPGTEGSPDWDLFMRLMLAGECAVHIPEVLYSWRVHAHSTADDAAIKPYVQASQKAVLRRFLETRGHSDRFEIESSPLLGHAAHWHFSRKRDSSPPLRTVLVRPDADADARDLLPLAREMAAQGGLIQFLGEDVEIENPAWQWEALGLFELHPGTVMAGGRIRNRNGVITEAGRYFGYAGACGCPNRGRTAADPGYFTQMWKQRSVSAVSTQFAVIDAAFLAELLNDLPRISTVFLGAWAGARALRTCRRVVYSPFLSGISDRDWEPFFDADEQKLFTELNRDLIPDRRFYSRSLSLEKPFAFAAEIDSPLDNAPAAAHCSL
jgi:glycosyltransferase involved in cell wall biosynthesis